MALRGQEADTLQIDIDDGFLNLIDDEGREKNDVRMPDGEVGEKITKLFSTEEKDTSMSCLTSPFPSSRTNFRPDITVQTAMGEETAIDAKESPK